MPASVLEAPLLAHSSASSPQATPCSCSCTRQPSSTSIFTIVKLAASFLCVYSAMDALSEYITSLLPHRLGDESLFLLQAALCASTLAAPAIVSSIGELKGMMLGGAAHAAYLLSLVWPDQKHATFQERFVHGDLLGDLLHVFDRWQPWSLRHVQVPLTVCHVWHRELECSGRGSSPVPGGGSCDRCQEVDVHEKLACRRTVLQFLLLLPITFYLGTQTAFWTGEFTKLLPAKTIGLVLFVTGVGQVIGSFLLSWLSDYLGCSSPTFLVGALASGTGLCMCFPIQRHEIPGLFAVRVFEAPALAYTAGLCFGVADGVLTSHVFAITSKVFQGSKPEIWAVFNLLGTAGAAATFWTGMVFPLPKAYGLSVQFWLQFAVLLVGSPLYVILDIWSAQPSVPVPA